MAITPPNFQKDAVPTPSGWRHPRTNELLVSRKITSDQIDEFYGVKPTVAMLKESPTTMEEATAAGIVELNEQAISEFENDDEVNNWFK